MKNDIARLFVFLAFKSFQYILFSVAVGTFIYGIINTFFL